MFISIRSSGRAISGDWGRCQLLGNVYMQNATDFRPILTEFRFSRQIFIKVPCIKFNGNSSSTVQIFGNNPNESKFYSGRN